MLRSCCLLILSMGLWGCSVGPKYLPPEMDIPSEWHSPTSEGMRFDTLECFIWWKSLNDPILDALIKTAAAQNLDLQIAASRVLEAREARKEKTSDRYPHIDASLGYQHAYYNKSIINHVLGTKKFCKSSGKKNLNFFEMGFDADWEIDLFGKTAHELNALNAEIEASEEDLNDIWVTLSAEVARNYMELRGFQHKLRLILKNITTQKDTLSITKALFEMGRVGTIHVGQAEEQLHLLNAKQPLLRLSIDKSIYRLSILLGSSPHCLYDELIAINDLPQLPDDKPLVLPSDLLRRRPDIRKAERQLAASTERVGSAVADLFPRFSLCGFIGDITTHLPSLFSHTSHAWSVGPQLLLPIFNSRMIQQDIQLNKIKTEQALYAYQKSVLGALEESENGIAALLYELERNRYLQAAVRSGQGAYEAADDLYQNGMQDYLEVLMINRSLLANEEALIESQVDLLIHYIALYKALGGGWDSSE